MEETVEEIEQFVRYLTAERNYSALTAKAYRTDMYIFYDFLKNHCNGLTFATCTRNVVRDYLATMYNDNIKKSSVTRKLAVLKSFYKFLIINNIVEVSPVSAVASPKKDKKIPVFLTEQDMEKLFSLPDMSARDSAMLELLYSSGIRIEEMATRNLKDLDLFAGTLKVFGKGSSERIVPVGDKCLVAIKKYIDQRRAEGLDCGLNSPLFMNHQGKRLSSRGARKILHGWFVKAGCNAKVSPHTLRHTFATHILDRGCDIRSVQKMLGHKNLSTTQIYTHSTLESLKRVYNKAHLRD